jgi:hypothetical protein
MQSEDPNGLHVAIIMDGNGRWATRRGLSRPLPLSLLLMVATATAGLTIRFGLPGLPHVISKYGGSMLWALMVYWIVSTLLPSMRLRAAGSVTATLTTAVELFKLYHSPALDGFRQTLPGVLLLGRFFSYWDVLAYWFAISVGMLADKHMRSTAN